MERQMPHRARAWRRAAAFAAVLAAVPLDVGCRSEHSTGPERTAGLAELHVIANVAATTIATVVVQVSAADIQAPLVFNLTLENGVASGVLRIRAGSARTIAVGAFDDAGLETHRGERTVDVQPGTDNRTVSITLFPIVGTQPLELWLGTFAVTISDVPATLRVGERATLSATVSMTTPEGLIPVPGAVVGWATATPGTLAVDPEEGVATGVRPGQGTVAATYGGVGALADITVDPRLGYYVSPTGTPTGAGTWADPWNLPTALSGAGGRVQPGDTIWLRGAVYAGDFRSSLTGSETAQIIVRRYPGEWATIEGRLRADGAYTTYWGFEIRQADPMATDWPALQAHAPGGRYVNLIVHDAGENGISFRTATGVSEVYGCILYNNGNNEGLDHGIYAMSEAAVEAKWITDNVAFNNIASGIQVFGDETHPKMVNVTVVGNISFNNSSIAVMKPGGEENITIGGDNNIVENMAILDNLLYFSPNVSTGRNLTAGLERELNDFPVRNVSVAIRGNFVVGGSTLFSFQEWEQAAVDGNTFVAEGSERMVRVNTNFQPSLSGVAWGSNTQHRDPTATAWRYANVQRTWKEFQDATGLGLSDQVSATRFTATKIVVRPNKYERGRAHIAIYNPAGFDAVSVDVAGILQIDDRYEVRNVHDVLGPPLLSGIYSGGALVLPMTNVPPPPAAGRGQGPVTGPYFNTFLLTLRER
jgi:hypothetical protein